jgi:hypothetical protein
MQKKIITGILVTLLFSCGLNKNKIMLDHKTEYLVPPDFIEIYTSQVEVDNYKSLFEKNANNSLVLYKIFKDSNTKIYISVCYNTDMQRVRNEISNSSNSITYEDSTKHNSFVICTKTIFSGNVLHYFLELDSGNKYLFSAVSENSKITKPEFIDEYIRNMITSN